MSKTITLKAFNSLPGVTISNFQLPSDDPAGGITISTDSVIPSPARSFRFVFAPFLTDLSSQNLASTLAALVSWPILRILLLDVSEKRDVVNRILTPFTALTANDLVLPPEATVTSHLSGHMVPQSGSDLSTIGKLFSEYLAADNITLSVQGDSVQPPGAGGTVAWLTTAFKTLTLDVILPGQKFDVSLITAAQGSIVLTI